MGGYRRPWEVVGDLRDTWALSKSHIDQLAISFTIL